MGFIRPTKETRGVVYHHPLIKKKASYINTISSFLGFSDSLNQQVAAAHQLNTIQAHDGYVYEPFSIGFVGGLRLIRFFIVFCSKN